ncbi:MAG: D-glycero-beta-D-manno-heptose 1-phosphate adenylyltransferase, partial [Alphaproteobacteria bacterium]|nr:D-glycero-beta-D-manno-heptose 1-phosphate adenylyltransferase [Alphaproteobacteria bacterium]
VIAALALGIAGGASFNEAAEIANYAGSIVVGKIGTATTTVDDLSQEIMRSHSENSAQNVLQLQQAKDLVERWRAKGQKIGFTNGCFDLIHPGHISLLRQARAACDKLIVGLNTDASVQRLKGPTRPVQNELSRATILSAFSDVDAVVLFDEDTPIDLIKALRPDVLIKGADYTVETVVGSDLVQGWGGKVVLADLVAGQSTTSTITRMQDPRKTSKN